MHYTHVKVCGLTRAQDANAAVAAGADALGVIFAPSKRRVSAEQAAQVLADVPAGVERVGVFVDASADEIEAAVEACGLTMVQLAGSESPELCSQLSVPAMKVVHVGTDFGFDALEPYRDRATALLLDTLVTGKAGGTSQTFDWQALGQLPGWAPIYIAGGLNPENLSACIATLHPFGVDVSSGVETSPGIKDHARIEAFLAAVSAADTESRTSR